MAKVNISKKLSMKVLVGNVKAHIKNLENGAHVTLAQVVGIARGIKTGESTYGPWTALTGDFVAEAKIGDKEGNRYRTGVLFAPDVVLDLILPHVEGLSKGEGVEMAFEIGVEVNDEASTGYVYTATFLTEPEENDPLEALVARALPAPTETVETQPGGQEMPTKKGK